MSAQFIRIDAQVEKLGNAVLNQLLCEAAREGVSCGGSGESAPLFSSDTPPAIAERVNLLR